LHSKQSGAGNLNDEPGATVILLNVHCTSTVPYSFVFIKKKHKNKNNLNYLITCNLPVNFSFNRETMSRNRECNY